MHALNIKVVYSDDVREKLSKITFELHQKTFNLWEFMDGCHQGHIDLDFIKCISLSAIKDIEQLINVENIELQKIITDIKYPKFKTYINTEIGNYFIYINNKMDFSSASLLLPSSVNIPTNTEVNKFYKNLNNVKLCINKLKVYLNNNRVDEQVKLMAKELLGNDNIDLFITNFLDELEKRIDLFKYVYLKGTRDSKCVGLAFSGKDDVMYDDYYNFVFLFDPFFLTEIKTGTYGYQYYANKKDLKDLDLIYYLHVMIHEYSHIIIRTRDYAYGYDECKKLDISRRNQNADNYAFFCCEAYIYFFNKRNYIV